MEALQQFHRVFQRHSRYVWAGQLPQELFHGPAKPPVQQQLLPLFILILLLPVSLLLLSEYCYSCNH